MIGDHKFEGFLFYTKHFSLRVLRNSEYELHFSKLWDTFPRRASSLLSMSRTEMTTLADDIKALMDLGISLERATELAVADRNKVPAPGNLCILFFYLISVFLSHAFRYQYFMVPLVNFI